MGNKDFDFNVESLLTDILEDQRRFYYVWEHDQYVSIDVQWGDWKHDHGFIDYFMEKLGFILIETELTEEDGSDCYSATHIYRLNEKEKIDLEKMEIIKGQDHCYWIYSNESDSYYQTSVSWNQYDEDTFIKTFNTIGFKLYGSSWIKDPDFDI